MTEDRGGDGRFLQSDWFVSIIGTITQLVVHGIE